MGLSKSDLATAMELEQTSRHDADMPSRRIGLAWQITKNGDTEYIWHNGGTFGFSSFIGFDKKRQRGVVVLSNFAGRVDSIGFRLLQQTATKNEESIENVKPELEHQIVGGKQQ